MSDLSDYQDRILHERTIPRREAEYADFSSRLLPELQYGILAVFVAVTVLYGLSLVLTWVQKAG